MGVNRTKDGVIYFKCYYKDEYGNLKCKKQQSKKWLTISDGKKAEREFLSKKKHFKVTKFLDLWKLYFDYQCATKRDNTINNIERMHTKYLWYFDELKLDQIDVNIIEKWQLNLLTLGISDTYIITIQKQLKTILNYGVSHNMLLYNPFTIPYIHKKQEKKEIEIYTIEQFEQFIHEIHDLYDLGIYMTLFYTGIRVGELLALTIDDYKDHTLIINKQKLKSGKIAPVKSSNGNRVIALNKRLYNVLDEIISVYKGKGIDGSKWLFYGSGLVGRTGLRERKNKYCQSAGLPQIRLHDFRHSNTVFLLNLGFTYNECALRLGDNVQTVINTYSHAYSDYNERIVNAIDSLDKETI